jgi:hypothetical protein
MIFIDQNYAAVVLTILTKFTAVIETVALSSLSFDEQILSDNDMTKIFLFNQRKCQNVNPEKRGYNK